MGHIRSRMEKFMDSMPAVAPNHWKSICLSMFLNYVPQFSVSNTGFYCKIRYSEGNLESFLSTQPTIKHHLCSTHGLHVYLLQYAPSYDHNALSMHVTTVTWEREENVSYSKKKKTKQERQKKMPFSQEYCFLPFMDASAHIKRMLKFEIKGLSKYLWAFTPWAVVLLAMNVWTIL